MSQLTYLKLKRSNERQQNTINHQKKKLLVITSHCTHPQQ